MCWSIRRLNISCLCVFVCLLCALIFSVSPARAAEVRQAAAVQQNPATVTGSVKDASGVPLVGAVIAVKGTSNGAVSDGEGNFSVWASSADALVVTYTGYLRQEIPVGSRTVFEVTMDEDATMLDETIVIGYGTTSARRSVSAVGTLKTTDIDELPYTSTAASLQGRIAGVIVQTADGIPGGTAPTVSIRGGGTPLYVIDGIIRPADDFNAIPSSDIASINILKDASATAVYGAQAGNGIVLVTTKQGREGLQVEYTGGLDFSKPTTLADRVGALQYVEAANAAARYDGRGQFALYSQTDVDEIRNGTSEVYGNQDWYDAATRTTAPAQRHNITISGKTKSGISHFTSVGLLDQRSIYNFKQNDRYQKYNIRNNVSDNFDKIGLEVGVNVDYTYEKRTPNPYGQTDIWRNLMGYNKAIDKIYNDDGTYMAHDVDPIAELDPRSGYTNDYTNTINAQGYVKWSVPWVEGLSAKLTGNTNYASWDYKMFQSMAPEYSNGVLTNGDRTKTLSMQRSWTRGNTLELNLDYAHQFGKHFVEVQGVYNYFDEYNEYFSASRTGFISNDFDQLSAGDADTKDNSGGAAKRTRIGYVGRLRYAFADKYFIEANFRYDGSDNFAANKRWGFFPSAAVAWAISEENFMKPLAERNIINFAKARLSYGQVGLEDGVTRFGYIPVYSYDAQATVIGGSFAPGFSEGNLVNPNALSWYTKDVFDVGVDLAFLRNRLSATFDYYYYKTKGFLVSPQDRYTTTLGKDLPQIKSNSVQRRAGYEVALRWKDAYRDFHYEVGFQCTYYNELWETKADEALTDLMDPRKRLTHRTNTYGSSYYYNDGLYQSDEDILNKPRRIGSTNLKQGDISYQDINGDGQLDASDQIKLGKPFFPSFDYGVDFNLEYKGFFLTGLLQGTGERYTEFALLLKPGNIVSSNYAFQMDTWSPDNRNARFPRSSASADPNGGNNTVSSDYWLLNASYFRIKSLQFGYDFKKTVFRNVRGISKFKLSVMATNLFTSSGTMDYFDPETYNYGESYPIQKTFSIVLNIGI